MLDGAAMLLIIFGEFETIIAVQLRVTCYGCGWLPSICSHWFVEWPELPKYSTAIVCLRFGKFVFADYATGGWVRLFVRPSGLACRPGMR